MGIIILTRPPTEPPPPPPEFQATCPHEEGWYDENGNLICAACGKVLEESA